MTPNRKKGVRLIIYVVAALVAGGFFLYYLLTYRLERFLKDELSARVSVATDSLYQLSCADVSIRLFQGEVSLKEIVVRSDSGGVARSGREEKRPDIYPDTLAVLQHLEIGFSLADLASYAWKADSARQAAAIKSIKLKVRDIRLLLDRGFFTLTADSLSFDGGDLSLKGFRLTAAYPMLEFAKKHPKHADWFNAGAGELQFSGFDLPRLVTDSILHIKKGRIDSAYLENFRDQQLSRPRKIVPFIYEGLQKAPLKIDIEMLDVNHMEVTYYELAKHALRPGKLFFTDMNGTFHGLTNMARSRDQFIRLEAQARLMGEGNFNATWLIPVDTLNDRFVLEAHLPKFSLAALNPLLIPLASAEIRSGHLNDLQFTLDANSKTAHVKMRFLYEGLIGEILKEKDHHLVARKLESWLMNLAVRNNNLPHKDKAPRQVDLYIERDPYHSIFNYIWQMLRPALMESAGIPERIVHKLSQPPEKE